jgi:hypothetical protein
VTTLHLPTDHSYSDHGMLFQPQFSIGWLGFVPINQSLSAVASMKTGK